MKSTKQESDIKTNSKFVVKKGGGIRPSVSEVSIFPVSPLLNMVEG